jgi:Concanavalin A-like lectin/glucanases superfamily
VTENASPQRGDVYLKFNGRDAYVEIPSVDDYSVSKTGELTIAAWMRPDTLNFLRVETNSDYIHWLGKGEKSGAMGDQEWTFRMYNLHDPLDSPSRPNRISFYLFNPQGGLGVGSYVQVPVHKGQWILVVGVADSSRTYFYNDGQYVRCDTYRGPAQGPCEIHYQAPPNENVQLVIDPKAGSAPLRLGTKDLGSFFEGGLASVRIWNRSLSASEISDLYTEDKTARDGLVAEFLLDTDTGTTAIDSAKGNNGMIVNATWSVQS